MAKKVSPAKKFAPKVDPEVARGIVEDVESRLAADQTADTMPHGTAGAPFDGSAFRKLLPDAVNLGLKVVGALGDGSISPEEAREVADSVHAFFTRLLAAKKGAA